MKVRAQVCMVMNLDKCIGCHTCSVTCKNVWTSREGAEYMWWNNVETRPGPGYPKDWADQGKYHGGWKLNWRGRLKPRLGGKLRILSRIFANTALPQIDDYYEPFTYDYEKLHDAGEVEAMPTARPVSAIDGDYIKVEGSANWEDDLGGPFARRAADSNFKDMQTDIYKSFEKTFMAYLPRICEHCLNPSCVAVCPSGSIYKRAEDGIVLVDQHKCRGFRMCISGCPYKKVYFNWQSGKAEKCTFCYPRIESGMATTCAHTCVGRIRYIGVILYDADRISEAASTKNEKDLYREQLSVFLDPNDPDVINAAHANDVSDDWIEAARRSPIYKMAIEWRIAFPLHPEFRTLPMVWYVPPLSPIQTATEEGRIGFDEGTPLVPQDDEIGPMERLTEYVQAAVDLVRPGGGLAARLPDIRSLQIPVRYLANLLTAGDEEPVVIALERMMAMRLFYRAREFGEADDHSILRRVGLSLEQMEEMYRLLAIADFDDRFVIPTAAREIPEDAAKLQELSGFTFSDSAPPMANRSGLFGTTRHGTSRPSDSF